MDLCLKLVEYLQGHGTCPPGSDISCYNVGVETFCDLDLRPAAMKKLMQHDGDSQSVPLRHSHGSHDLLGSPPPSPPPFGSYDSPALKAEPSGISYELWEAVERTANLFRIYPAPPREEEEEEEENESEEIKLHQSSSDRMDRPAGMMARGDLLQAGSCPDFAALSEADEDGDCVCPEHTTCHDGPTVGCPTKSGRASKIMFDKDCETCTCETPQLEEPASKESSLECPSSAAIRRPDPDGDCFCGRKLCMQGEEQGCTSRLSKDFKHFPASCSDCRCVDAT
ncbi:unnamed protein product [Effrenium voratum]|nr:unnamed protein product [Effrenium voratum]